jgi:hypothetical protein
MSRDHTSNDEASVVGFGCWLSVAENVNLCTEQASSREDAGIGVNARERKTCCEINEKHIIHLRLATCLKVS